MTNDFREKLFLEKVAKAKQLAAYRHEGFWQCMDTKKDKDLLQKILKEKKILNSKEKLLIVGGTGSSGILQERLYQENSITSISTKKPTKRKLSKINYII